VDIEALVVIERFSQDFMKNVKKRTCFYIFYHYNKAVNASIGSLSIFSSSSARRSPARLSSDECSPVFTLFITN
jgi:hypothetical protein